MGIKGEQAEAQIREQENDRWRENKKTIDAMLWAGGVAQAVRYLPCKHQGPEFKPIITRTKENTTKWLFLKGCLKLRRGRKWGWGEVLEESHPRWATLPYSFFLPPLDSTGTASPRLDHPTWRQRLTGKRSPAR
jgi:hypothetical protein